MKVLQIIAATIIAFGCDAARAAEYIYRTNAAGDVVLTLSGPITADDGAIFHDEVNRNKPRIIELEGPGGDLLSTMRIGVIIHERHISTHAIGPCRSACAYMWMAGLHMLADEGVEISNHLPVPLVSDGRPNQQGIALFGWYLGKLNISIEMMEAFLEAATGNGTLPNQYFDMLTFAEHWNKPVTIVTDSSASSPLLTAR